MANHLHTGTGVLVLDRVTPVIKALFGGFLLHESRPGRGRAHISRRAGDDPQWSDVMNGLKDLATQLNVPTPDDEGLSIPPLLGVLATYFGADQDEELARLIDSYPFGEDTAELDALFLIATRFDDGHRLAAIQYEESWHCSDPQQCGTGGKGFYLSQEVCLFGTSSKSIVLGDQLRRTILATDVDKASAVIEMEIERLLESVNDEQFRLKLQRRVAERLSLFCAT